MKRDNYISWQDFFMGIAKLAAQRSKDPRTQCGACIIKDNKIIGVGYNGMPNGISDISMPWLPDDDFLKSKYTYVVHAELNAILNTCDNTQLKGSTMYCTLAPCNECVKAIIQSGITEIVFAATWRPTDYHIAAKRMLSLANVKMIDLTD